ncbi:MAG TPA: alpha/beta family hydrolase [Anaeromyxobacter sp.]
MTGRPLLLLAPGAGAPSTSPWMRRWARRLAGLGEVVSFDYPYALAGRRSPDRLPVLVAAHRAALAAARRRSPLAGAPGGEGSVPRARPVVLVGKSMGGRVGCHAALEEPPGAIAGIVCLGFPLRGQKGQLRDEVLLALRTPVLFVQGSCDALCPLADLERVRPRMTAPSSLHVVEGGNHSLEVGVRALAARSETRDDVDARALEAIAEFVRSVAA